MRLWLLSCVLTTLVSVVLSAAPGDEDPLCSSTGTDVLLDSSRYSQLIPDTWTSVSILNGQVITNASEWTSAGQDCMQNVQSCVSNETETNRENWLITQYISFQTVGVSSFAVRVQVTFSSMCSSGDTTCENNFSLHVFQTDTENDIMARDVSNYQRISAVGTDETVISVSNIGMYLALEDSGTCVTVSSVRVFFRRCTEQTLDFVAYPASVEGSVVNGTCVANSNSSNMLQATCSTDGSFQPAPGSMCTCGIGITGNNQGTECTDCKLGYYGVQVPCMQCPPNSERLTSTDTQCSCQDNRVTSSGSVMTTEDQCNGCATNFFLSSSDSCVTCPANSENTDPLSTSCMCTEGRQVSENIFITTGQPCTECRQTHFPISSNQCAECPPNSRREFPTDNTCMCIDNRATPSGDTTTTNEGCTVCLNGFFMSDGSCEQCPPNSDNTNPSATDCMCMEGFATSSGATMTTNDACSDCAANFFGNNGCIRCPANSNRDFMGGESCSCDSGYVRKNTSDITTSCLPIVGFDQSTQNFNEGEAAPHIVNILLRLSATADVIVSVMIGDGMMVPIQFQNSQQENVSVPIQGDEIGLEEDEVITVSILNGDDYIAGDPDQSLYGQIEITVEEDDVVQVGFIETMQSFNQSGLKGFVYVMRVGRIAVPLQIRVFGGDGNVFINTTVTFSPESLSPTETQRANFSFIREAGDKNIQLSLEVVNPTQFISQVNVDSLSDGLSPSLTLQLKDDLATPEPFPVTIVVAVVAGAIGALLVLVVLLLICVCLCKWSVSRQGYYTTYEDKATEPPPMLRYSASLRSISSQTVIPAADGRGAAGSKEHEFYV